ncbi:efflux RND transporter periplasmic adaptor subunit (plasmid) [Paraburkholderia sp. PREW-6R]|uniref:efflux RND transporter periplasmic adaptor subunit n=1 Tax=Paraburkholderia sp. PREW-6R TaxID=3141544 RepID=UPI0031F5B852
MRNSPIAARRQRLATYAFSLASAALMSAGAHAAGAASASAGDDAADRAVVSVQTVKVQRAVIAQPVRAYGIVAASASNLTTVNLPYTARIVQMRVQAGQSVKRGTPLFVAQADPAAVLAASQAKSAVTLALGELARTQSLYDKGLATQSQLATARKAAEDARQALAAQNQTGVASGNKIIAAPIDGVVLQVSAQQGDQVQPGAAILQLAGGSGKDAHANVMLGVEPSDLSAIHAGDTVTLHGLSTSLASSAADGHVVLVGASVDQQSQLVNVGANVPLGQGGFIPGTRVSADIATRSGTHWVVPRAAVLKDDHGAYVFQITPQNKAHRVAVVMQVENGDRYGVDGPIDGAEGLVVSGNYELKDGMTVRSGGGAPR